MSIRVTTLFLLCLFVIAPFAEAKNKNKQTLPDYVLNAETVYVSIYPDAGEPVTNPTANRTAQDDVERALTKWGRFRLVQDPQIADLVIAVRTGHAGGPTISNSPLDTPPLVIQQGDGNIRVGGQKGRPGDLEDTGPIRSDDGRPRISSEIGPAEDMFAVYRGRIEYPLDSAPVWRYMAKNALKGPQTTAIEEFKKALTESEKQRMHKP
jgi:hypothetical protein